MASDAVSTSPSSAGNDNPIDPHQQLIQILAGFWVARAVQVAASLKLADQIEGESSRAVADIALATGAHSDALQRLLRGLASAGIFAEESAGRFRHTPTSRLLRTGEPGTMRAFFESVSGGSHYAACGGLEQSIRNGKTAFDQVHGEDVWAWFAKHPHEQRTFDQAMTDMTALFNPAIAKALDLSNVKTLIDVGGGHGVLLASLLKSNPHLHGVLFDQPHVVEGGRQRIIREGLSGRCRIAGGDFFESIPAGADACLMKFILHDWDDERSTRILRNVHKALPAGGKLLVVEVVLKPGNEPDFGKLGDLNMLVMTGGRERTEADFAKLFAGAGFELVKAHPTESPFGIVEGVRR
jgi:hypothetical protein